MGYKCPKCNDEVYFSLTALKLAFKGHTYSGKVACMIEYYRSLGYTRDKICDLLAESDIEISDRNVDILYNKVKSYMEMNYDLAILNDYKYMQDKFKEIRICLDLITVDKSYYIIMYGYFTGNIIGFWKVDSVDDDFVKELIRKYTNKDYNITTIITIRPQFKFYGIIKENIPSGIKMMSFSKF